MFTYTCVVVYQCVCHKYCIWLCLCMSYRLGVLGRYLGKHTAMFITFVLLLTITILTVSAPGKIGTYSNFMNFSRHIYVHHTVYM